MKSCSLGSAAMRLLLFGYEVKRDATLKLKEMEVLVPVLEED